MDNTDFITILAWMKHLKASLVEKMVFAIIYGFSKDRRSDFRGSRQYLADWCECSTKTIDRALASLCNAGYIIKREEVVKDVRFCHYTVNFDTLDKMSIPWTKCPVGGEILAVGVDKLSHNNIDNNADNKLSANRDNIGRSSRFVKPTIDEVRAYCAERRNTISPEKFIDYYESNGWMVGRSHMKDWKAAVRNWESRDKEPNKRRSNDAGSPSAYRHVGKNDYYGEPTI